MHEQHKLTGGCMCGTVRYEATGKPMKVAHCHCQTCRRSTGAAFATGVCFPTGAVTWNQGEPTSYLSSASFDRLFCSRCGSSVAQHNLANDTLWLMAGTLDHPETVTPEFHMFASEHVPWADLDDGLTRHSTFAPITED